MLGLNVDGCENTVVAHTREQPKTTDPGSGPDFDNRFATAEPGQQAQQRTDRRCHRAGARIQGTFTGRGDDRVLGYRGLGMAEDPLRPARLPRGVGIVGDGHSQQRRSTAPVRGPTRQVGPTRLRPARTHRFQEIAENSFPVSVLPVKTLFIR